MTQRWRELNRAMWDERVPIHLGGDFYDVTGFRAGRCTLRPDEIEDVGPVLGKDLVHLQCHFGLDTLSWARLGARVTGLDFSAPATAAAQRLAREMSMPARFVSADVYDAPEVLGTQFDIVYTGRGALCWLPDMQRWAGVVARLLRPGGTFYLTEFHPTEWVFAENDLTVKYDYFTPASGLPYTYVGSYADPGAETVHNQTVQWNHGIGEVVTGLIDAGLEIRLVREHDCSEYPRWPFLQPTDAGGWRLPDGIPSLPLMYTVRAVKRSAPP